MRISNLNDSAFANITGPQEFSACDSLFESIVDITPRTGTVFYPAGGIVITYPIQVHTAIVQIPDPDDVHDDGQAGRNVLKAKGQK